MDNQGLEFRRVKANSNRRESPAAAQSHTWPCLYYTAESYLALLHIGNHIEWDDYCALIKGGNVCATITSSLGNEHSVIWWFFQVKKEIILAG